MPGLVFRRRRFLLGGDELMVPYATSACGRTVWVLFMITGLITTSSMLLNGVCLDAGYEVFAYSAVSIIVAALSIFLELMIAKASTHGTIIDPGPRNEMMARHLSQKVVLGWIQLSLGLCGLALLIYVPLSSYSCRNSLALITTCVSLTMISQFLDSGVMYCCLLAFTTKESIWLGDDELEVDEPRHGMLAEMEHKYEDFCRTLCKWAAVCFCAFNVFGGGEKEADFAHVSRVFGRMLSARRYMDVVATDIAAGLILVRHVQKAEDYKRRDELRGEGSASSPPTTTRASIGTDTDANVMAGTTAAPATGDDTVITTDPGLLDAPDSHSISSAAAKKADTSTAPEESAGEGVGEAALEEGLRAGGGGDRRRRSRRAGGRGGGDAGAGEGCKSPGAVPLAERPRVHRKYYKVSRGETILDVTRGGEDWRLLEETAHFVKYANVMYSVWGTLVIDPWNGIRRMIRRSASWCPRFLRRKGARNRKSLFRTPHPKISTAEGVVLGGGTAAVADERTGAVGGSRNRPLLFAPDLGEAEIRGDNCWGSHETALRAELPDGAELVLAHFNNCFDETPYCVVVDHPWQSIVITIRGSHSFEDFLVDAMAEPCSLERTGEEWGFDGSGMHAHEGILRRAEWIRRDLEESGVLGMLLGDATAQHSWGLGNIPQGLRDQDDSRDGRLRRASRAGFPIGLASSEPLAAAVGVTGVCAGYTVRPIGHSLGAGCAALLTLLLKNTYPSVKALAVSPPGGLVSEGPCREMTEALVTSLILNDDVVPRMSAQSVDALAEKVLEVLGRSRVNKLYVMRSLLRYDEEAHRPELYLEEQDESWSHLPPIPLPPAGTGASESGAGRGSSLSGASESPSIGDDDGGEVSTRGTSRYHRQLRRYREHLVEEGGSRRHLHQLRLPGKILHIVNTDYVTEKTDLHACQDGCLATCCNCVSPTPASDSEVAPCCCTPGKGERRRRVFTPVWALPQDLNEIKVTPAFLVDHNPDEIIKAVKMTMEDLGVVV